MLLLGVRKVGGEMSKSLVDALKQAINEDDFNALNAMIGEDIQKVESNDDFRRSLYNIIQYFENDVLKKRDLSALLAPFLNKKYIKTISRDEGLLSKLKDLEVDFQDSKINFFTVVAGAVKERKLLDKILTSQDIEQIYVKCLQGSYSHPVFGLLETAAMYNNIEFIDIFLRRVEQGIFSMSEQGKLTKQLTKSQESLNSLGSDESSDSGLGSGSSNESDVDPNESYEPESDSEVNTPSNGNELGVELSKSSNIFTKQDELKGLVANLVNIMSTAISMEAYETVSYLCDKFTKTDSIEIKEAFITALEDDEVKKEYQGQQTTRLNSKKIIRLIEEWNTVQDIQLKFQVVKSNINKLEQIDFHGSPEDFKEKMEVTYRSLNELKNSVINILQTAIDKKDYNLIKNLSDNFNAQTTDIKDVFNKALENENVQKAIENSKKIKKILYSNEQSALSTIEKLILRIKDLINQIINYFHIAQGVKKQSCAEDPLTSPSSNINLASAHNCSKHTDAPLLRQ